VERGATWVAVSWADVASLALASERHCRRDASALLHCARVISSHPLLTTLQTLGSFSLISLLSSCAAATSQRRNAELY